MNAGVLIMKNDCLTLGRFLSAMYSFCGRQYGTQKDFLNDLFTTVITVMIGDSQASFEIPQPICSKILTGFCGLPRYAYTVYVGQNGDEFLRKDMERHVSIVAVTCRQQTLYYNSLRSLVEAAENLEAADKEYILVTHPLENRQEDLADLIYRALRVLIREPVI